jgi:hypothetical protein
MSLRTGVEMISLSLLFNKVAGIFGLLAILTGYTLNATQLSMYLYSVTALILMAYLMPYIREQSPMECLALAWFYTLDTIINSAYTAAFSITWFMTNINDNIPSGAPRSGAMDDTAGFRSPKYNVTQVDVGSSPATDFLSGQGAAVVGIAAPANTTGKGISVQIGGELADSAPSLIIIIALTIIRVYFILVMMAYARHVLRQYNTTSSIASRMPSDGSSDSEDNLFATNMPAGQGWKGRLGRVMLLGGKQYFLGDQVKDDWEKGLNSRFRQAAPIVIPEPRGTFERERRARSGTGPPTPLPDATKIER